MGKKFLLPRLLVLLCASLQADADEPPTVLLYGDSLLDGCDPCASFPAEWQVREYAWSGSEVWHQSRCPADSSFCVNREDVVLPQGDPPACVAANGSSNRCLAANPDADAVVLQWGSNDARKWCWEFHTDPLCEPGYKLNVPRIRSAWSKILAAVPEAGPACVIVAPPPVWSDAVLPPDDRVEYTTTNARLAELRRILRQLAREHECLLLDLYDAFSEVNGTDGEQAMLALYKRCPGKGGIQSPDEDDCVHCSSAGRELVGTLLADATETAVRLKRAKHLH